MAFLPSLIGAGASLIGGLFNGGAKRREAAAAASAQAKQNAWNEKMADKQNAAIAEANRINWERSQDLNNTNIVMTANAANRQYTDNLNAMNAAAVANKNAAEHAAMINSGHAKEASWVDYQRSLDYGAQRDAAVAAGFNPLTAMGRPAVSGQTAVSGISNLSIGAPGSSLALPHLTSPEFQAATAVASKSFASDYNYHGVDGEMIAGLADPVVQFFKDKAQKATSTKQLGYHVTPRGTSGYNIQEQRPEDVIGPELSETLPPWASDHQRSWELQNPGWYSDGYEPPNRMDSTAPSDLGNAPAVAPIMVNGRPIVPQGEWSDLESLEARYGDQPLNDALGMYRQFKDFRHSMQEVERSLRDGAREERENGWLLSLQGQVRDHARRSSNPGFHLPRMRNPRAVGVGGYGGGW